MQVEELHRVYRVQKLLMDEMKKEVKQKKLWNTMKGEETKIPNGTTDLQAHQSVKDEMCSRERSSGSCSAEHIIGPKIPKTGFNLEMPAEEEGTLIGECEAGPSSYIDEEIELDLTLSIGGSNNETKKNKKKLNFCGSFKSDRLGECSDPTTPMSSSSVTFEQERKESSSHRLISHGLKLT